MCICIPIKYIRSRDVAACVGLGGSGGGEGFIVQNSVYLFFLGTQTHTKRRAGI